MLLTVNGRLLLVGDGLKVPKEGRKMPAVKKLHQESSSNTKPPYTTITSRSGSLHRGLCNIFH